MSPQEIIRPAKIWKTLFCQSRYRKVEKQGKENAVRDPGIFVDNDKRVYLLLCSWGKWYRYR